MRWLEPTPELRKIVASPLPGPGDSGRAPPLCSAEYKIAAGQPSFVTRLCGTHLHHIDVLRFEGRGLYRRDRKPAHIEADKKDDYLLTLPVRAHVEFSQRGMDAGMEPGSFVLMSSTHPFADSVASLSPREAFSVLHVRIAGPVLRSRLPHADDYCDRPIRLHPGSGAIMKGMCELAIMEGHSLSLGQAGKFGGMLIEAVMNATADAPEILALPVHNLNPAHLRVWRQAQAFIDLNLSDPALDVERVAQYCGVSKRYLQDVFAETGSAVAASIREKRLQHCRDDLANPLLRNLHLAQIVQRWGFLDLPHFCRSYKSRFGVSPGRERGGRS